MKNIMKRVTGVLLVMALLVGVVPMSSQTVQAAVPTLDSEFATLVVGTNDLKVEYYDGSQIVAGCFTAPEKGNYTFYAINIGELAQDGYLLNNNFSQIEHYVYKKTSCQYNFDTYLLEQGEKFYFYVLRSYTNYSGTLAVRLVIEKEEEKKSDVQINNTPTNTTQNKTTVSKSKITISKKNCSLKKGKKIKLKLKNNKKKVIWVSREKKIASVTSKGVVKARKKGTTYIYAIANHKLYKCKVKVY